MGIFENERVLKFCFQIVWYDVKYNFCIKNHWVSLGENWKMIESLKETEENKIAFDFCVSKAKQCQCFSKILPMFMLKGMAIVRTIFRICELSMMELFCQKNI